MAKFEMTKTNQKDWKHNTLLFLIPLGLIYLTQVQSVFANGFDLKGFIPTEFTMGAIVLYITNTLTDLGRKYLQEAGR